MASPTEFHASIADVTNEQHQNMAGFRYAAANPARAEDVLFACVCLRASISYALEAAFWCIKAKR
jgi:hypothetical protein